MSNVTEADHAHVGRDDNSFRGEKPPIPRDRATEAAAARTPQPLSTAKPIGGASKQSKAVAVAKPVFHPAPPPKSREHQPNHNFSQNLDRCIAVAAQRVAFEDCLSPPEDKDTPRAIASSPVNP